MAGEGGGGGGGGGAGWDEDGRFGWGAKGNFGWGGATEAFNVINTLESQQTFSV